MKKVILVFLLITSFTFSYSQHPNAIIHFLKTDFETNNTYPWYPAWLTDTINPWVIDTSNAENTWQIGRPQKAIFDSAYNTPNALVTDTIDTYPPNNHSIFEFLVIKPEWAGYMRWNRIDLYFFHKYDMDEGKDGGYIEFSYDQGKTWINVINLDEQDPYGCHLGNTSYLYSSNSLISDNIPAFTGTTNEWVETQIELFYPCDNGYLIDSVIIRFNFISDSIDTGKEGWMIDDIYFLLADYCDIAIEYLSNQQPEAYVYPNPVIEQSILEFTNLNHSQFTMKVFNIIGKRVFIQNKITGNQVIIYANDYIPGIYYYVLNNDSNQIFKGRFVVE